MWDDFSKEQKIQFIREHRSDNSAARMATLAGAASRNVIIGFAHRNKIELGTHSSAAFRRNRAAPAAPRPPNPPKPRQAKGYKRKVKITDAQFEPVVELIALPPPAMEPTPCEPVAAELFIPEDKRLTLLQLTERTCKWPIGDPLAKDFYFCGQHSLDSSPYCEFHARRAYHQVENKRR